MGAKGLITMVQVKEDESLNWPRRNEEREKMSGCKRQRKNRNCGFTYIIILCYLHKGEMLTNFQLYSIKFSKQDLAKIKTRQ